MHSTEPIERQAQDELSLADALAMAVKLHRGGYVEAAETLYQRILEVDPRQPDALNFLGVVTLHRGRIDTAIELIRKSIEVDPGTPERYNNLGNVLLAADRVDDAIAAYEKAIELAPGQAGPHNNLGIIFKAQRRFEESAREYERAIEIDPAHVEAYTNYGNLLAEQGKEKKAIWAYSTALTLRPYHENARTQLALAHVALGDFDAAAKIYREWLEREPDHAGVKHLLAACSGENVPERASDAYIETTFDSFSASFDSKLARLDYRAPELVLEALRRAAPVAEKRLAALDAGCGTGLCGPLIAPYVSRLHGVDLSSGMLEMARARGVYDELEKAELTEYLQRARGAYDLVLSADTLVYFGVLDPALHAAARALRPAGLLLFTVEKADEAGTPAGFRLNPHGRYSHTRSYVEQTLRRAGFAEVSIEDGVLRQEHAEPVAGLVVTARMAQAEPK